MFILDLNRAISLTIIEDGIHLELGCWKDLRGQSFLPILSIIHQVVVIGHRLRLVFHFLIPSLLRGNCRTVTPVVLFLILCRGKALLLSHNEVEIFIVKIFFLNMFDCEGRLINCLAPPATTSTILS